MDPLGFFKKIEGGPFGGKLLSEKFHNAEKTEIVPVLYVTRKKEIFLGSLGQMIEFGTIKFGRRTILVSSCGLKKRVSVIVALHFMKRRLKKLDMEKGPCVVQ